MNALDATQRRHERLFVQFYTEVVVRPKRMLLQSLADYSAVVQNKINELQRELNTNARNKAASGMHAHTTGSASCLTTGALPRRHQRKEGLAAPCCFCYLPSNLVLVPPSWSLQGYRYSENSVESLTGGVAASRQGGLILVHPESLQP